jgi:hypothetical protein
MRVGWGGVGGIMIVYEAIGVFQDIGLIEFDGLLLSLSSF